MYGGIVLISDFVLVNVVELWIWVLSSFLWIKVLIRCEFGGYDVWEMELEGGL